MTHTLKHVLPGRMKTQETTNDQVKVPSFIKGAHLKLYTVPTPFCGEVQQRNPHTL